MHLTLSAGFQQPLLRGVLPAGLRRLDFPQYPFYRGAIYPHRLQPGVLPSQLRQLSLGTVGCQPLDPGVIPPSVTRLLLGAYFDHPLQRGCIPHGVTHLHMGAVFDQQLPPGVLPASLLELGFGARFSQPLKPGSLPDGLRVLTFPRAGDYRLPLLPGVVPASVEEVGLSGGQRLVADSIPSTVRLLRVDRAHVSQSVIAALSELSSTTKVVYWRYPDW